MKTLNQMNTHVVGFKNVLRIKLFRIHKSFGAASGIITFRSEPTDKTLYIAFGKQNLKKKKRKQ